MESQSRDYHSTRPMIGSEIAAFSFQADLPCDIGSRDSHYRFSVEPVARQASCARVEIARLGRVNSG